MPWRAQPWQPGLGSCSSGVWGCCWAPPSSGNSPGLLPSTAEEQEAAGLAGNAWAARGALARSQQLQMGSPGLWVGDTGSCKNKEGLGSREMGRGQRVSSALGSSGDKPKTPVWAPPSYLG